MVYLASGEEAGYPLGMVKRIFFDFGGCLDAPGIHTRTLFFDSFLAEGLVAAEARAPFQEAYTQADQRMMASGEAKELGLRAFNRWNAALIAGTLSLPGEGATRAADRVTALMEGYLAESRGCLELLRGRYELGVISNFTGNLEVILRESGLRGFFDSVTESFHAGASKPDARIFHAALASQKQPPASCLYVGDNPVNDIAPAKALGLKAVLIHPPGGRRECGADGYLESLRELPSLIQSM